MPRTKSFLHTESISYWPNFGKDLIPFLETLNHLPSLLMCWPILLTHSQSQQNITEISDLVQYLCLLGIHITTWTLNTTSKLGVEQHCNIREVPVLNSYPKAENGQVHNNDSVQNQLKHVVHTSKGSSNIWLSD